MFKSEHRLLFLRAAVGVYHRSRGEHFQIAARIPTGFQTSAEAYANTV
jgi:hypothetical protein